MSAPYNDIETKVEEAFSTVIAAAVTAEQLNGATVLTGLNAEDVTSGTRIVCECTRAKAVNRQAGNWIASVSIVVRTKINPRPRSAILTEHRSRTAYVRDVLLDTELAATLSDALGDFTCQGIPNTEMTTESGRQTIDPLTGEGEDCFISAMTLDILCFAKDA